MSFSAMEGDTQKAAKANALTSFLACFQLSSASHGQRGQRGRNTVRQPSPKRPVCWAQTKTKKGREQVGKGAMVNVMCDLTGPRAAQSHVACAMSVYAGVSR